MTAGIWLFEENRTVRPKSKKAVKEAIASNPASVRIEDTSLGGYGYDGLVSNAPDGRYDFVGPDPYEKRNFYGNIIVKDGKAKVT